jgi:hypothetical protein
MSQGKDILDHLHLYGSITPLEALEEIGCMRLAARVNDLRRDGHAIRTDLVKRNGKVWARYSLEPRQAEMW